MWYNEIATNQYTDKGVFVNKITLSKSVFNHFKYTKYKSDFIIYKYTTKIMKSQDVKNEIVEVDNNKYLVDTETGELKEILSDKSPIGKERPWRKHKKENMTVEKCYTALAERGSEADYWSKKAERLQSCGSHLTFNVYNNEEGKTMKVKHAESCRVRLCPLCTWRRSIKIHTHMRKILEHMQEENKYQYIFVTLTVPNVPADKLNSKLDELMTAWNRLQTYKKYKTAVKGWYRGLEITHNVNPLSASYDTYHPHFHCIIAVDKNNYFNGREYIKQEEWLEMWRKATRDNSILHVNVKKVKPKKGADPTDIVGAVCEVTKYTVKNEDYILPKDWNMTLSSVEVLDKALANRRLVAFGGVMKEWHKKLNLDDEVDGDLIEDGEDVNGELLEEVTFCWHVGYQQYLKCD